MSNAFNFDRFIEAQEPVIDQVRRELANGHKQTHWMWFVAYPVDQSFDICRAAPSPSMLHAIKSLAAPDTDPVCACVAVSPG